MKAIKKNHFIIASAVSSILLSGCAAKSEHMAADVFDTSLINSAIPAKTIQILTVLPAKVAVDNSENKKAARNALTLLGAVAGGSAGYQKSNTGAAAGAVGGAALGHIAASAIDDKTLVEGVQITYQADSGDLQISAQVGKRCQFKEGTALLATTTTNETRVMPNAECPAETKAQ